MRYIVLLLFILNHNLVYCQSINSELQKEAEMFFEKSNYFYSINLDSCFHYTKKAEQKHMEANNWSGNIYCLNSLATLHYYKSDYQKYFVTMDSVKVLTDKYLSTTDTTYLFVTNNMGAYYRMLGNYPKAINEYKEALNIQNTTFSQKALVLSSLSYSYNLLGDYDKAIKCLNQISLNNNSQSIPIINRRIQRLQALGYSYYNKKQYAESNNSYKKALTLLTESVDYKKNKKRTGRLFYYIAKNYLNLDDTNSFKVYLNKIEKLKLDKESNLYGDILVISAKYYYKSNQFSLAHQSINQAIKVHDKINNKEVSYKKKRTSELMLSDILLEKGDITKAGEILSASYSELQKVSNNQIRRSLNIYEIKLLNKLKDLAKKKNELKFYIKYITASKNLIKSLRQQNSTASHKDFWANENLEIYQDAIGTFISQNDINTAFTFSEENKSNLLIQSLNDIDAKTYAGIPEELLDKEREMRAQLQFYQKKKFELENSKDIDSSKLLSYSDVISKTDFAIEAIVDTLEMQYPEYYEIKYNEEDLTVEDIQSLIDNKTAFIEYFVGKDSSYVFTITKNDIHAYPIENINDKTNILLNYYNSLNDPTASLDSLNYYSSQAYNLILKNAVSDLNPNVSNLVIVPDDILNNLPFGMMKDSKSDTYIGSQYNIQYQYSGRLWRLLKNRKSEDKKYDFLGYAYNTENLNFLAERACATMEVGNLLCSEKEIASIANILSEKELNLNVSLKEDILKHASDSKIIHLATHSCLDNENSDYSRIFFDDGYITNIDLQLQKINADLAVLSACESGYGELVKGEGAMSISKGFFHAGCKSTLVSLWPVDDCSTSEFMRHFYTFLLAGDKKDIALKKAKQTYRETAHPSRMHPYYWAGFILIGDDAAVWGGSNNYLYWVIGLVILILIGGFTFKRMRV